MPVYCDAYALPCACLSVKNYFKKCLTNEPHFRRLRSNPGLNAFNFQKNRPGLRVGVGVPKIFSMTRDRRKLFVRL